MRNLLKSSLYIFLLLGPAAYGQSVSPKRISSSSNEVAAWKERVGQIKKSTVRIFVNGRPSGTGFIISKAGLIATCFHVVQQIQPAPNGQPQISYAPSIQVEFTDGNKLAATVHPSCVNQGFMEALSKDYAVLEVKSPKELMPVTLGTFMDADEGAGIYMSGFPFGLDKPFVSTGMLSTKINVQGYLGQGANREAALLDITLNKGNSGGPVVLIGKEPKDDKVIGIANFQLGPLSPPLKLLAQTAQNFPGRAVILGIDFKEFSLQITNTFEATSVGIGGCISIDYLKSRIK